MPKLNSLEVVHQDTNKDSYETLHDIIVGLKGSQNQEVVDGKARALYEALLEMYVNDKEAFARRIETLKAEFGNSLAQVVEEMLAYASASEAYAKKITTVSAEVANANAMVQTEMYARVTEDEALAQLITTLSATVSGNTAAITNEAIARANGDSANATSINTVTARLDTGDFAAVKTQSSATATKVGNIEAKWGVTVNANGNVAGIQLLNGTNTQSSFIVDATKFIVRKPNGTNGIAWNGSTSTLAVAGDVYADNFYGNVISTGNVNSGAIGNIGAVSTSSSSASLTLTVSGVAGESYILYILAQWPQVYYATTTIYVNGSPIRTATPLGGNEGSLMVTTTVSPGTYTIQSSNSDGRNAYMALYAQVLKR